MGTPTSMTWQKYARLWARRWYIGACWYFLVVGVLEVWGQMYRHSMKYVVWVWTWSDELLTRLLRLSLLWQW